MEAKIEAAPYYSVEGRNKKLYAKNDSFANISFFNIFLRMSGEIAFSEFITHRLDYQRGRPPGGLHGHLFVFSCIFLIFFSLFVFLLPFWPPGEH